MHFQAKRVFVSGTSGGVTHFQITSPRQPVPTLTKKQREWTDFPLLPPKAQLALPDPPSIFMSEENMELEPLESTHTGVSGVCS